MADIEGEVIERAGDEGQAQNIAVRTEPSAPAIYNPMDAPPEVFAKALQTRQDNYDAFQGHLQSVLVVDVDYGKMHVMPKDKCRDGNRCTNEWHWSKYQLRAPGADKILGILGLGVHYPDIKDYKRAILTGHHIEDVLIDCQILGLNDQVMSHGAGAAERKAFKGDLNNTIKRACKRARLDAVLRLPVVSALFEGDFLKKMAAAQNKNGSPSAKKRGQRVRSDYDTGVILEVCPIGKKMKGKRFDEMAEVTLLWIIENVSDKPDIYNAAKREYDRQYSDTTQVADGPDAVKPLCSNAVAANKSEDSTDPATVEPTATSDQQRGKRGPNLSDDPAPAEDNNNDEFWDEYDAEAPIDTFGAGLADLEDKDEWEKPNIVNEGDKT